MPWRLGRRSLPRSYIDVEGLTTTGDGEAYARAIGLDGHMVPAGERVTLLARLIDGAGVTILTGPEGAPFWRLASAEIKVRIVPDGEDYVDRAASAAEWAYRAVGCGTAATGQLLKRKTPPPDTHREHGHWAAAQGLLSALGAAIEDSAGQGPIIEADFPTERLGVEGAEHLLASDQLLALDYEWNMDTAEPIGLAIGTPDMAYYMPVRAADLPDSGEGPTLTGAVDEYLRRGGRAVLHGGRADLGTQYRGDALDLVGRSEIDDTMVMAYLAGEPVLALKDLTRKFLGRDPTDFPGELSDLPTALGVRYAAADGRNTYDLFGVLARTLVARDQWGVYQEIERPLIPVIVSMEQQGVPVDIEEVKRQYRDTVKIEMGVRYAIKDHYGLDVADDNGKTLDTNQARQYVERVRGSDPGTLDQRVLTMFPEGEIDLLLLYRRSRTLRRNFLGKALKYQYAVTHAGHEGHLFKSRGRFTKARQLTDLGEYLEWKRRWLALGTDQFRYFPRWNQAGAVDGENHAAPRSGRLSSAGPNFTNQSRGALRRTYIPPAGCDWWSFDYSGLELHIAADLSGDPEMLRILGETCPDGVCKHKPKHGDLHGYLQSIVEQLTGNVYDRALVVKPFNFMELYGGSPAKGVEIVAKSRTYITLETAKQIDEGHHKAFPGFWKWAEERHAFHRRYGYGHTIDGRRRYEPEVNSRDPERQAYGMRALLNHEIQGTGADIVKRTMVRIVPILRRYGAHLAAQVHDELDGWLPKESDHAGFKAEIEEAMCVTLPNGLKLKVEGGFGPSWGDAH